MSFRYQPQWQGPLSGRSFEKQTEDFLNGIESRVDEINTRQTPSDMTPMAPGVGSAGTAEEYSRGDHSHPLQPDVSGNAGSATKLETARTIGLSGEGSGLAAFDGTSDVSIPVSVSCIAAGSTEQRSIADRFADAVNVRDFGALGTGADDDTSAIVAAFASASANGKSVWFPSGVYACTGFYATTGFDMSPDAKLLYAGDGTTGAFVRVENSNLFFGNIVIDCNSKEIDRVLNISGNNNTFLHIKLLNGYSDSLQSRGLYVLGIANTFSSVEIYDFEQAAGGTVNNDSMPQGVVLSGSSDGNYFGQVYAKNGRATVVNNSSGTNQFGVVASYEALDNGFYAVGPGTSIVNSLLYDGYDAALGCRHGSRVMIDNVQLRRWGGSSALFFGNTDFVAIGRILVDAPVTQAKTLLGLAQMNLDSSGNPVDASERGGCGTIKIGSISGDLGQGYICFMPESKPDSPWLQVESLSIGQIDVDLSYIGGVTKRSSWCVFKACKGLNVGSANIRLRVTLPDPMETAAIYITFPTTRLVYNSLIGVVLFEQLKSDGTPWGSSSNLYTFHLDSAFQQKLRVSNGTLLSNGNRVMITANSEGQERLLTYHVPNAGYFYAGDIVATTGGDASVALWYCRTSGSPGTWQKINSSS